MTTLPPFDVKVSTRRWSCVLDVRLALSRWGLMFAWRIADEMNVWLVPSLWELLDSADYYLRHPKTLQRQPGVGESGVENRENTFMVESLGQWQTARLEEDLPSVPIYWAGDASHESLLPKEVPPGVIRRFAILAEALDGREQPPRRVREPAHPFLDCFRDAVALTAALGRYRPVIFTLGDDAGHLPQVCRYLESRGIPCRRAPGDAAGNPVKNHLGPTLFRSGVGELIFAGMPLAAVHIVAPRTFVMPESGEGEVSCGGTLKEEEGLGPPRDWWGGASAHWYHLA